MEYGLKVKKVRKQVRDQRIMKANKDDVQVLLKIINK